jgi:hypothetical protein
MPPVLRPLALGELLDQCFQIYRKKFFLFVGLSAIPNFFIFFVQAIFQVGALLATRYQSNATAVGAGAIVGGLSAIVALVLYCIALPLSQAATALAVSEIYLGREARISGIYRHVIRKTGRYLLIVIEIMFAMLGVGAFCALIFLGIRALGSPGLGAFIGIICFVFAAIYIGLIWAIALPAAAVENIGFVRCLARSYSLGQGARLRILVIMILATVIMYALMFAIYMPSVLAAVMIAGTSPEGSIAVTFAVLISWFIAVCLGGPLAMIALTLAYYDQRVRKEGFDIQFLMASQMQPSATAATAGAMGTAGN